MVLCVFFFCFFFFAVGIFHFIERLLEACLAIGDFSLSCPFVFIEVTLAEPLASICQSGTGILALSTFTKRYCVLFLFFGLLLRGCACIYCFINITDYKLNLVSYP